MRQKRSRYENWAPANKGAERRQRGEQKPDQRREEREQSNGRDETLKDEMQIAGRDEKRLETETQSKSENKSNDSQMLEPVRSALLYKKSATPAVVLHVESDLDKHASGRRKRRKSSASVVRKWGVRGQARTRVLSNSVRNAWTWPCVLLKYVRSLSGLLTWLLTKVTRTLNFRTTRRYLATNPQNRIPSNKNPSKWSKPLKTHLLGGNLGPWNRIWPY